MKTPESYPEKGYQTAKLFRAMSFGMEHGDAVRELLKPVFKLGKDWKNVPEHCMTVATLYDVLAEELKIPKDVREKHVDALVMHDSLKHVDIRPADFEHPNDIRTQYDTFMQGVDPEGQIRMALQEDNRSLEHIDSHTLVLRLIDNMCMESTVAPYQERLDEVRDRREAKGQDLRSKYGDDYWEREARISQKAAEWCVARLQANGHAIQSAKDLPSFLIRKLLSRIGGETTAWTQHWESGGTEMLSPNFYSQTILDTPRKDTLKNEDRGWSMVTKMRAVLIVHDGATGIDVPELFTDIGQSPGWIAAEEGMKGGKRSVRTGKKDPLDIMFRMNTAIDTKAKELGIDAAEQDRIFSTCALTATVEQVAPHEYDLDYANAGDSALLVWHQGTDTFEWLVFGQGEYLEILENKTAWDEVQARREAGHSDASMGEVIAKLATDYPRTLEVINRNRMAENTSADGGASLKGTDSQLLQACLQRPAKKIRLKSGDTVIAISDGALPWVLVPTEERKKFVEDAIRTGGPVELLRRRKELGNKNMQLDSPPTFKQWDDATAVAVKLL
jgi:hypothetical protein